MSCLQVAHASVEKRKLGDSHIAIAWIRFRKLPPAAMFRSLASRVLQFLRVSETSRGDEY